jgi:hypothetical protein
MEIVDDEDDQPFPSNRLVERPHKSRPSRQGIVLHGIGSTPRSHRPRRFNSGKKLSHQPVRQPALWLSPAHPYQQRLVRQPAGELAQQGRLPHPGMAFDNHCSGLAPGRHFSSAIEDG